jgi:hypothetical protein
MQNWELQCPKLVAMLTTSRSALGVFVAVDSLQLWYLKLALGKYTWNMHS